MVNTHRKGSAWRLQVERFLQGIGYDTAFRSIGLPGDDIRATGESLPRLSVECKAVREITLASFVDQCLRNAPSDHTPVLFIKRRGKASADHAYVVLTGEQFARLVTDRRPI